jgi:hypothetical protein
MAPVRFDPPESEGQIDWVVAQVLDLYGDRRRLSWRQEDIVNVKVDW